MKSKLKTSLLAILLTLFAVCTLLFGVQAFPTGNIAKAAILPTGTQGDTHVTIAADKTTVDRGSSVTFTVTVTASAARQSLQWLTVDLRLVPITSDNKANADVAKLLTGSDIKLNDPGYQDLSMSKFAAGTGYSIGYGYNPTSGLNARVANTPIVKKITVNFPSDFPSDITSLTWGFAYTPNEKVVYGKDNDTLGGAEDRIKSSAKYGQLTYEVVTLTIAG